jgi:hypothetical protein
MLDLVFLESSQTLIPFLFVLAVIFGALGFVRIFNRGVSFLIAAALAFFVVINPSLVSILWSSFGFITVAFIALFFMAFIFEVFGIRKSASGASDALIINGAILFLLLSIGYVYIDLIPPFPVIGGGQNLLLFFAIIFILAIFWAAYKTGTPQPQQMEKR